MARPDTKALVFSCLACRTIVADSLDYVAGIEQPLQMILVAGATGVRQDTVEQHAAEEDADAGRCIQSPEVYGRVTGRRLATAVGMQQLLDTADMPRCLQHVQGGSV